MKKLFENLALGFLACVPVTLFWILNAFGGIIGGLWLIIIGDWGVVVFAIIAAVIYPFIYGLAAMATQYPLVMFGNFLLRKGWKVFGYPVIYISILIMDIFVLVWVFLSFNNVLDTGESTNIIPFLLVAYTLAVSPFTYMAKGESPDSIGTNITLLFVFASSIIYGISWLFISHPVVSILGVVLVIILMFLKQIYQLYQFSVQQTLQAPTGSLKIQ